MSYEAKQAKFLAKLEKEFRDRYERPVDEEYKKVDEDGVSDPPVHYPWPRRDESGQSQSGNRGPRR